MWGGELDEPPPPSMAPRDTLHGPHHTGGEKKKRIKGEKPISLYPTPEDDSGQNDGAALKQGQQRSGAG